MLDPDFADRSTGPQRQSGKARKTSKAPVAFFARTPSYQCRGKSPGRPQPAAHKPPAAGRFFRGA